MRLGVLFNQFRPTTLDQRSLDKEFTCLEVDAGPAQGADLSAPSACRRGDVEKTSEVRVRPLGLFDERKDVFRLGWLYRLRADRGRSGEGGWI
jgi:hypothetical protein